MVNSETARNVVGIIGNVISFGLFLSPSPTFYKIIRMRNVEEFKADPYLATVMNCMLWVFYGMPFVHPNSILVITINGIGLVLEAIYLTIYFLFASRKQRLRMLAILGIEFVAMAIFVGVVITQAHTYTARSRIVGILCIIFGSAMYASPLTVMKKVITTKSVKYMPFFLSLTNFLNGICWTLYALIKFDLNMVIPNGLGAFFGAVQLILYGCFYRTTVWDEEDDDKAKSEIQLPKASVAPGNAANC